MSGIVCHTGGTVLSCGLFPTGPGGRRKARAPISRAYLGAGESARDIRAAAAGTAGDGGGIVTPWFWEKARIVSAHRHRRVLGGRGDGMGLHGPAAYIFIHRRRGYFHP